MKLGAFWILQGTRSLPSRAKLWARFVSLSSRQKSHITGKTIKLSKLSVQSKLLDACDLEKSNRVWSRILDGLPAKQLSFILRASSDTLPTPLNQRRWKMRFDSTCHLCKSNSPTVLHILNYCPTALNQKRFTWRHDSVLLKLFSFMRSFLEEDIFFMLTYQGNGRLRTPLQQSLFPS